tara:strand:- start:240547 stop:241233 length:687 start_codon:yes stop_codon:yes gene_type:complete
MDLSTIFKHSAPLYVKCIRSAALVSAFFYGAFTAVDMLPEQDYTPEQKVTLAHVFNDSLDVNVIQYKVSAASDFLIKYNQADAYTIGNTVHLHSRYADPDSDPLEVGSWIFLHEHAHVWQNQNCNVRQHSFFNALADSVSGKKHNDNTGYMYMLDAEKDLSDYNHEQQASMIADYFRIKAGLSPVWLNFNQDHKRDIGLYEKVLERFLDNPSYIQNHCDNIAYAQPQI